MHTFAAWAYAVMTACLLGALIRGAWYYVKAWDIKFDRVVAEENQRKIDWEEARSMQVILWTLSIPLGLIVIGLMVYHWWYQFNWEMYTYIAIGWFLSAPLRRLWQIAVTLRADRHLRKHGLRNDQAHGTAYAYGAFHATRMYYSKGLSTLPKRSYHPRRKAFIGRLKFLNKIAWMWRWLHYLRILWPVLLDAVVSLVWPFAAMFMAIHHSYEATERLSLSPWWGRDRY
ncbi:MAG TPA: hypothetical protein VFT16_00645 [Candidatus Saccharimonadales bacterium]|nr:hypothetical protein [Candidatus Saccharimonadales bacterium]